MKEFPDNEEAYLKYWKMMKSSGNLKELEEVSIKLKTVCASPTVSTNSWIESIFKYSEMLVWKGHIDEAICNLK